MSDLLTTGAERLAGVAAAYVGHIGPVDEHTIVTVDAEAFTSDPGVKALVEFAKTMDRQTLIHASTRIDLARKALKLWEHGNH